MVKLELRFRFESMVTDNFFRYEGDTGLENVRFSLEIYGLVVRLKLILLFLRFLCLLEGLLLGSGDKGGDLLV